MHRYQQQPAIEALSLQDETATVTFTGGRSYDYTVADVTFVSALLT